MEYHHGILVEKEYFLCPSLKAEAWRLEASRGVYFSSSNVSECHLLKRRYAFIGSIKMIPGNLQSVSSLIDLDTSI